MSNNDVLVRLIKLPCTVRGFTVVDEDGNYNVYINDRLNSEMRRRTIKHELRHIARGDFWVDAHIRAVEFD